LVIEAAYAQSRLPDLFPFPTHGTLHLLRAAPPPWPESDRDRLPFIVCGEPPYKIYTPGYGDLLGEAATPAEAAELLVAHLPDAVGEDADEVTPWVPTLPFYAARSSRWWQRVLVWYGVM
jgi:hypothetical protein